MALSLIMRLLILKEKKEYVPELERTVTTVKQRVYLVTNLARDFQTTYGVITKKDLQKPDGSSIKSGMGKEFVILTPGFVDLFKRLKKLPQTIPTKDLGFILAETGVGRKSICVDAGTGSGALASFLALHCKHVYTYDIREDHIQVAAENFKTLGIKNITQRTGDITKGIREKKADLLTLDLPEPWLALKHLQALKIGGWIVSYSPTVPQVMDFVSACQKDERLLVVKTVELIERLWEVSERRVRPKSSPIGHSGFLTFVRRVA